MLRVLLLALSAAGAGQVPTESVPSAPSATTIAPTYAAIRQELEQGRAAGTLSAVQTRLLGTLSGQHAPALRDFVTGYAALLSYDRQRADQFLERSLKASPSAYAAAALATNASDRGRQTACIERGSRGLALPIDRDDVFPHVELRVMRGQCFFHLGKHSDHRADVDEALRLATEHAHESGRALALRFLGSALHNAGESSRALTALREAIAIDERLGNRLALALDLMAISYPYPSEHPFADKLPLLDRAIALAAKARDRFVEGRAYGIRGASNMLLARHGAALRDLQTAATMLRGVDAARHQAVTAGNLSLLFTQLGEYDRAEEQSRLSASGYTKAENPAGGRVILSDLGNIALRRQNTTAALAYHREVVATSRDLSDRLYLRGALLNLGSTHMARREWTEAEAAIRESLAFSDEAGEVGPRASAHAVLGDLLRQTGRAGEAREAYTTALQLARGVAGEATLNIRAHHGLGLLDAEQRRFADAIDHYRDALNRVEEIREATQRAQLQMTYFADKHALYVDAIDALVEAGRSSATGEYVREAFLLAERAKARTLLDAIASGLPDADARSVSDIAAALDPSELLVEFVLGSRTSFVFTLTRQGSVSVHRLPARSVLEKAVGDFRELVSRRPSTRSSSTAAQDVRRAGRALYKSTLEDALAGVRDYRRIVIVADGLLFYAPFEAFTRPGREQYFAEEHEIVRAPSASVLTAIRARPRASGVAAQFVGFGDPSVAGKSQADEGDLVRALERSGFSFPPLPGSRREVTTVAQLFGPASSRVYTGRAFTAATALQELQRPNRIVHFATHAILDERVPGRSGIVVSHVGGPAAPSIIRAQDLAGLKIPVDLITLSGCQTGLGRVVDGEGVMGLSWAFSRAGAGSLMVTLWNVSDAASATLMVAFYRAMRDGQPKATALATARRELLQGPNAALRHPYYWAGYALVGDSR